MRNPQSEAEILRIEKLFADPNFKLEEVMEHIDPDEFVSFDFLYNIVGKAAHEAHITKMLAMPMTYSNKILRMEISAGDDHGFCNSIQRLEMYDTGGNTVYAANLRITICYRKKNGRWLQVAQHASVPLDLTTGAPDNESTW